MAEAWACLTHGSAARRQPWCLPVKARFGSVLSLLQQGGVISDLKLEIPAPNYSDMRQRKEACE